MQVARNVQAQAVDAPEDVVLPGGWYTLLTMMALTLFGVVDRQVLTLAAAPISASLHLSDNQLGMVQGLAFAIFSVLAIYPAAWAADRIDRRLVIGVCVVVWSLGTAACGLARNFEQLFLAAIAMAAGEAGLAPISLAFVPDLFKGRKRIVANALLFVFSLVGIAAALALGGQALGGLAAIHDRLPATLRAYEPWRLTFFAVALPAPLFLLLLAFTRLGRRHQSAAATEESGTRPIWPFVRQHWQGMLMVLGGLSIFALGFGGYAIWLPVATARQFGTTPAQNGTGLGIATAIGSLGGVAIGTLVVRRLIGSMGPLASIRFLWVAILVALPVFALMPFVDAPWQAFTLFGFGMFAGTAILCVTPTMLQDMAPAPLRVRMFAIWGMVYGIVGGLSPTLIGEISSLLGPAPHMLFIALSAAVFPAWAAAALLLRFAERPFTLLIRTVAEADGTNEANMAR